MRVDPFGLDLEDIAGRAVDDYVVAVAREDLAQAGDLTLDHVGRRIRRLFAPELVEQGVH